MNGLVRVQPKEQSPRIAGVRELLWVAYQTALHKYGRARVYGYSTASIICLILLADAFTFKLQRPAVRAAASLFTLNLVVNEKAEPTKRTKRKKVSMKAKDDGTLFNEACKQLQLDPDQLSEGAEFQILEIWKRRDAFKAAEKKHGVPAYVMASFMLIETGMNSRLLLQANNPGGVKWRGKGKFILAWDDCGDEQCKFQVYPSAKQGIEQWVAQTLCAPIYRMHWPSRKSDVEGWIAAYAWAGENKYNCYWSANSRKSGWKNRVNLINRYNLDKL